MKTATPQIRRPKTERVLGIIRVSEQGDREDEHLHSPTNQLDALRKECDKPSFTLIGYDPEIDVSGGLPLEERPVLHAAVLAVEAGEADVIMAPALDRLVRNRRVQDEIRDRVQAAGGRLISLDMGEITNGTPEQDFANGIVGDANELMRKQISVKTKRGHKRAIELGRNIGPTPPGYRISVIGYNPKGEAITGPLELDPPKDAVMREAFEMRAKGATFQAIRDYLAGRGILRTPPAVRKMLANRVYLGEVNHGKLHNPKAHNPIVDRALFERVQRMTLPGGRQARSDHLLARQGILRCGTCGSKMSVGHTMGGWAFYRCGGYGCERKQNIGAKIVEAEVVDYVKRRLAGPRGTATAESGAAEAAAELEHAQAALDATLRAFDGLEAEPVAIERLRELRDARDAAGERYERAAADQDATTIAITVGDWDQLTLDERRGLIKAVVERVTVAPGRGKDRIRIEPRA